MKRYSVRYVGNDSRTHSTIVWAKDHKAAVAKVSAAGADSITGVRKAMAPVVVGIACVVLVAVPVILRVCRHYAA